jgi:four helix bundle protein
MYTDQLVQRTKLFALEVIRFFQRLPKTDEAKILGKQLLRSGTSVASNYRAARRARSPQEFYAKMCIIVEENDESLFWLELIRDSGIQNDSETKKLMKEAEELLFIFAASKKSLRLKLVKSNSNNEKQ